jgi:hypothetical protein
VENSLRDAKLSIKDIDEVILVGGSTLFVLFRSYYNLRQSLCKSSPFWLFFLNKLSCVILILYTLDIQTWNII